MALGTGTLFTVRTDNRRIGHWLAGLAGWLDRYRQRRAMVVLDDRMLRDCGLAELTDWTLHQAGITRPKRLVQPSFWDY